MSATQRQQFLASLTPEEAATLRYDWRFWGRPSQQTPTEREWETWLIQTGRGWGKTRTGGEQVRDWVNQGYRRIALIGPTLADVRQTMITGETTGPEDGLLNYFPPHQRPVWVPSKRMIQFHTGAIAIAYSSEEPERLRGPQHEKAWCDELRAWKYPDACWDMLQLGLRQGDKPQAVITTTPKTIKLIREIIKEPGTIVTRGRTNENMHNLSQRFLDKVYKKYKGTSLGKQELDGIMQETVEGALWTEANLDRWRVNEPPQMTHIAIGIDPSTTNNENSDACGIVAVGRAHDGHRYPLRDETMRARPKRWATKAVNLFHELDADMIVAEVNQGGLMVEETIHAIDPTIPIELVHATKGKRVRAEPISLEYEQGLWHHAGSLGALEEEMTTWTPDDKFSPNRIDALVWAGHYLRGSVSEFGVSVV